MNFSKAFEFMKQGEKVKLPSWQGYWYWSKEKQTIIIHTKEGEELDIRETQTPDYTFSNIASEFWEIFRKGKVMISQPMAGMTTEEIKTTREKAIKFLISQGYEVVNTLFEGEWFSDEAMAARGVVSIPLCYLSKSLEAMSQCDAVYFCKGWLDARGCRMENAAASGYGLKIIYEETEKQW